MDSPTHEIVQVAPAGSPDRQALYDQCIHVRIEVFVHEQKFPLETEVDEIDSYGTHFLLRLVPSETPIGTIRMHKLTGASYYKLTRLVVLKEYRGFRLGAALVERAHQYAVEDHCKSRQPGLAEVVTHSQLYAKPFYARFGYSPEGEEFDEDGAPHQRMKVRLGRPGLDITKTQDTRAKEVT
ncbi:acyl-CoA N-acyltransferase [Ramaria rubella]|nr:acyl-CoA N-acyltransferase [Ramaria rubella]